MHDIDLVPFREKYTAYAQRLLFDVGMEDLEQPLRGQFLASIDKYMSQIITYTVLTSLDKNSIDKISQMLEQNETQDEVVAYIVACSPGIEVKIANALDNSYAKILQEVRQLTTDIAKYIAPKP